MPAHTIVSVQAKAAAEAGALDGHEAVCSCGYRMGTSLSAREAARLGDQHLAYMARRGTAAKPRRQRRVAPWER